MKANLGGPGRTNTQKGSSPILKSINKSTLWSLEPYGRGAEAEFSKQKALNIKVC